LHCPRLIVVLLLLLLLLPLLLLLLLRLLLLRLLLLLLLLLRYHQVPQAMMELGATVCKPVNPSCNTCPVSSCCAAYKLVADHAAAGGGAADVEDAPRVTDFPEKVGTQLYSVGCLQLPCVDVLSWAMAHPVV
jgi:hypothetical protein